MDLLLFLIKKHSNNKTVSYNDKLACIRFIKKTNHMRHGIHQMLYYILTKKLQNV